MLPVPHFVYAFTKDISRVAGLTSSGPPLDHHPALSLLERSLDGARVRQESSGACAVAADPDGAGVAAAEAAILVEFLSLPRHPTPSLPA